MGDILSAFGVVGCVAFIGVLVAFIWATRGRDYGRCQMPYLPLLKKNQSFISRMFDKFLE